MEEAREYRVRCALFGEPGHEYHRYPKSSQGSAHRTASERNHKAELDAAKPAKERYMDHKCAPYVVEYRSLMDWTVLP